MKLGVVYRERRFVPHSKPQGERSQEVVGFFARLVSGLGAHSDVLTERPHRVSHRASQKATDKNGSVPHIVPGHQHRTGRPAGSHRLIILIAHGGKDRIEVAMPLQPLAHRLQQRGGIPAVVIRKAHKLALGHAQSDVACPAGARLTLKMVDVQTAMPLQHRR